MKALIATAVVVAAFPALAAEPARERGPESGFTLLLGAGYGLPLGKFATTNNGTSGNLSDEFTGQIPIRIDLGYRFKRNFVVAGYLQIGYTFLNQDGPGLVGRECHISATSSCNGNVSAHIGVEFLYYFMRDVQFEPWVGIGAGYERTVYTIKDGQGGEGTISYSGWEFLNLQVGANYKVSPNFGFGPYLALSVGQYDSVELSSGGNSQTIDIAQKELHEWLQFGIHGTFDF